MSKKIDISSDAVTFQCDKLLQISNNIGLLQLPNSNDPKQIPGTVPPNLINIAILPNVLHDVIDFINALSKDRDRLKQELVKNRQELSTLQTALASMNEWVESNINSDIE